MEKTAGKEMQRRDVIDLLAQASLSGYLGLFVGSGFSRAATGGRALDFAGLVQEIIDHLGLDIDIEHDPAFRHRSYPQICSHLVQKYGEIDPSNTALKFREAIAHVCNFQPSPLLRQPLSTALQGVHPSWILTTNYDLLLETLFDEFDCVLPERPLVPRPDRVPIYHLHGHRLRPASIKITEEDYVSLLGPIDYQRLRLPLLLLESTTLMLGYSLGDMNVRAAMEWARSFDERIQLDEAQGQVVQALYVDAPATREPYRGPNQEWVLEIDDLQMLLVEIGEARAALSAELADLRSRIHTFLGADDNAEAVAIEGSEEREEFLRIIRESSSFSSHSRVVEFLDRVLEPIWDKATDRGGFDYYDDYLCLLIDVLEQLDTELEATLLGYLGDRLDRVAPLIDPSSGARKWGYSWKASSTWRTRRADIPKTVLKEIRSFAESNGRSLLLDLLSDTAPETG